jgi:hypothetical protein
MADKYLFLHNRLDENIVVKVLLILPLAGQKTDN